VRLGPIVLLLLAPGWSGCRDTRSIEEVEFALRQAQSLPDPGPAPEALDALSRDLWRIERLWLSEATPVRRERLTLQRGTPWTTPLLLEAGQCVGLAAVGAPVGEGATVDVDLWLHDPDGRIVAQDLAADAWPVVPRFCATVTGAHAWRLEVVRGAGAEVEAGFWVWDAPEHNAIAETLREQAGALHAGLVPAGAVQTSFLATGLVWETPLVLHRGQCWSVQAMGDPETVIDLDLELVDSTGEPLVRDLATDARPSLRVWCPESTVAWRLRFRMYQGHGRFWWQVWSRPRREGEPSGLAPLETPPPRPHNGP
jgi:hypothetical protein